MKLALSTLGASAVAASALVSVAIAQPPGRGPGAAGFALLQHDANGDGRLTRAEFDAAQRARFDGGGRKQGWLCHAGGIQGQPQGAGWRNTSRFDDQAVRRTGY